MACLKQGLQPSWTLQTSCQLICTGGRILLISSFVTRGGRASGWPPVRCLASPIYLTSFTRIFLGVPQEQLEDEDQAGLWQGLQARWPPQPSCQPSQVDGHPREFSKDHQRKSISIGLQQCLQSRRPLQPSCQLSQVGESSS